MNLPMVIRVIEPQPIYRGAENPFGDDFLWLKHNHRLPIVTIVNKGVRFSGWYPVDTSDSHLENGFIRGKEVVNV